MAKEETAEQKLLKMIEATSGSNAKSELDKTSKKRSFLSILKIVNILLIVGVVAAGLLLFMEVKRGTELLGSDVNFSAQVGRSAAYSATNLIPTIQKVTFYLADVGRRNIFEPYEEKASSAVAAVSDANRNIAQKTANLKLVGVAWFDKVESASAMIEDTDRQVTYFLQAGEKVGDIVVKTIYADSVELGYENEEIIISYDKTNL